MSKNDFLVVFSNNCTCIVDFRSAGWLYVVIIRLQTERATDRTDAPYKPLASSRQDK